MWQFSRFFTTTPEELITDGLFDEEIAIAFVAGEQHRNVSIALFAKALIKSADQSLRLKARVRGRRAQTWSGGRRSTAGSSALSGGSLSGPRAGGRFASGGRSKTLSAAERQLAENSGQSAAGRPSGVSLASTSIPRGRGSAGSSGGCDSFARTAALRFIKLTRGKKRISTDLRPSQPDTPMNTPRDVAQVSSAISLAISHSTVDRAARAERAESPRPLSTIESSHSTDTFSHQGDSSLRPSSLRPVGSFVESTGSSDRPETSDRKLSDAGADRAMRWCRRASSRASTPRGPRLTDVL